MFKQSDVFKQSLLQRDRDKVDREIPLGYGWLRDLMYNQSLFLISKNNKDCFKNRLQCQVIDKHPGHNEKIFGDIPWCLVIGEAIKRFFHKSGRVI